MSKDGVRRIEIFTGAGSRRRWSREAKLQIVAESYGEDTTVSAVARRHALTVSQLFAWRRELGPVREEASQRFVPVTIADVPARGDTGDRREISIELCGAVVRVPAGADGATIRSVVQALRAAS